MRYLTGMIAAAALAATPAAAQDNNVAGAADANMADVTATEPVADPTLNGLAVAPEAAAPVAAPAETAPARPARRDGFPWGLLGLLGLAGLLGRMRR